MRNLRVDILFEVINWPGGGSGKALPQAGRLAGCPGTDRFHYPLVRSSVSSLFSYHLSPRSLKLVVTANRGCHARDPESSDREVPLYGRLFHLMQGRVNINKVACWEYFICKFH
ncbi:hypothetical protein KM043_014477 [Ampulex compressa]|nr:hypothetical protein KM043_014477 [Ampulex compressa]